jgi:8-oxo-dGTP diphosphatase
MGAQGQGADATQGRWLTIPRTLSFVRSGSDVLLMKRGAHKRVFPNLYNGLGGHIERDEDALASARREIFEESGLHVRDLRLRAVHHIDAGAETGILLFVFTAWSDSRELVDCDEGTLHWVPLDDIASLPLVEDVEIILSRLLALSDDAPPLFAHVSYDSADEPVMRFAPDQPQ